MKIENDINGLVQIVSNATESYTTALFLADNQRRLLKLWHYYSLGDNVNPDALIPYGVGPIGWVAENKEDFDINEFSERDSSLLGLYNKSENIKSFFAVPILNDNDVLEGVISIDSKKTFVFSIKDQKNLRLLAVQFANLINNIRVERFIDTETSDVEFICMFCRDIGDLDDLDSILQLTLKSLTKLVECDSYFISLQTYNDEVGQFSIAASHGHRDLKGLVFSDQYGLAGCVIEDKKPFLLGNRKGEFGSYVFAPSESLGRVRSFLGVPLLLKEDVLGLICLVDSRENAFNLRDLQVVSIMADNVSLAIANIKSQEKIHSLSYNIDGLTGLYNFLGFQECLEKAIHTTSRKHRPLSLLIMDIDRFNMINRSLGYESGNAILKQISQLLLELSRNNNIIVTRCGPDEFAVILPNISDMKAFSIAEEIRSRLKSPNLITLGRGLSISFSIGLSSFPQDSIDKYDLIDNALSALSSAKQTGGDKVIMGSSDKSYVH